MAASVGTLGGVELAYSTGAGEWPIKSATVYDDRAEIKRTLTFVPKEAGPTLLKLKGLPNTLIQESIRADVSTKNARLVEVYYSYEYEAGKPDEKIASRLEEIKYEQQKAQNKRLLLNFKKGKITLHQEAVLKALDANSVEGKQEALDPTLFAKINKALNFYDNLKVKLQEEFDILDKIDVDLQQETYELQTKQNKATEPHNFHVAHVTLEIPELLLKAGGKPVDVDLFYIARGASWLASYDIRVEKGTDKASLTYYGEVVNGTAEDWVEVDMALSTAKPSVGGALPPLPRKQVDFKINQPGHAMNWQQQQIQRDDQRRLSIAMAPQMRVQMATNYDFAGPSLSMASPPIPAALPAQSSVAASDGGGALFKIQRLANIETDHKPHRQTIAIISLNSLFTHAASPKVSKNVFLKCSTKNESDYSFLPGILGVYIDGSFISDSTMDLVRPNEDFSLFLGIDDSVKLNYSPEVVKKKTVTSGNLMQKTKRWNKTTSRDISIINNSANPINCCIYEQLPLSKDGKIKVELKKPDIKKTSGYKAYINSFNNLETKTRIEAGKRFDMTFEYTMEWPENEEVQITQRRGK